MTDQLTYLLSEYIHKMISTNNDMMDNRVGRISTLVNAELVIWQMPIHRFIGNTLQTSRSIFSEVLE